MPRKKKEQVNEKTVRITYPVLLGNRIINPGETATVPAYIAIGWIEQERAVDVTAEDKWQPEEH